MTKYNYKFIALGMCSAAVLWSSSAMAGFEFVAPVSQGDTPQIENGLLPEMGTEQQQPARPEISWGEQQNIQDMNNKPQAPLQQATPAAPEIQPMPAQNVPQQQNVNAGSVPSQSTSGGSVTGIMSMAPTSTQQPQSTQDDIDVAVEMENDKSQNTMPQTGQYEMAVGFGNDLPLISALRQVVPSDYTYVLQTNIDSGQKVSWNGGQEWPAVLNDMLAAAGLRGSISGNIVTIHQSSTAQNNAPVASAATQPAQNQMAEASNVTTASNTPASAQPASNNMFVANYNPTQLVNTNTADEKNNTTAIRPGPVLTATEPAADNKSQPSGEWTASSGSSLKKVLESWSDNKNVNVFWSSGQDYVLPNDVNINGTYEEAVNTLLKSFANAEPKPMATFHQNGQSGPSILVIETRQG